MAIQLKLHHIKQIQIAIKEHMHLGKKTSDSHNTTRKFSSAMVHALGTHKTIHLVLTNLNDIPGKHLDMSIHIYHLNVFQVKHRAFSIKTGVIKSILHA